MKKKYVLYAECNVEDIIEVETSDFKSDNELKKYLEDSADALLNDNASSWYEEDD